MNNYLKKLIVLTLIVLQVGSSTVTTFAGKNYNYNQSINSLEREDVYVYDSNDSIITTKTGIPRELPKVTGLYDRSKYPIPMENKVPDEETFKLIKKENKELMDNVEKDIANGTLTKHIAADGQFYGSVPDDALGVEKKAYINTNAKWTHSLGCYVPAGEIATVTLNDEALKYAKQGKIKISVGMTLVDATEYWCNSNEENRMPYLGKTFNISQNETKVGTPFGGMVYIFIDESVPSGLNLEVDIKGVVDTPYYDLGRTTKEEWEISKDAPGVFAEIRTPYLRFVMPAKFIRNIEDPYKALLFWTNVVALSADTMGLQDRTIPMTLTFDQYISAGIAYASVGGWTCNLPPSWTTGALDYENLMKNGDWGTIHEINHHYQSRYSGYYDEWGLEDVTETTNNALSAVAYILYTNIAAYRGEDGTQDWNKVADPYSSLKQMIYEGDAYYSNTANSGNFMYSTFAHEIGPLNFVKVIKSTYEGGTFNGIHIPAYDYKLESQGGISKNNRYDDLAYRLCVATERDYTWFMINELQWPLKEKTIEKIKALKYKENIPVQTVYGMGEVGRETGRPYYVPSTGYNFNFESSLVSPGKVTVVDVSNPKYGTLTKNSDGTYDYKPSSSMGENDLDEFVLTVRVEADKISHETKLNCTIGLDYNNTIVEKYNITKWDIHEALEDLEVKTPYATSSNIGMRFDTDYGNNLAKSTGYFTVEEGGEYEFQAFGDDRAVFELHLENKNTLQSLTEDYAKTVESAYELDKSTSFTVTLEANKAYAYTLIANNNGGIGWADVNIRKTSGDTSWKSIDKVYSSLEDVGKTNDKSFEMPKAKHVRPSYLSASNKYLIEDISVISTPNGVIENDDPNSINEGNVENIVDGDMNTYFHSSYSSDKTELPHEYIFDLGGEKSFDNIEIYTRKKGDMCGVIGDYEVYIANEYDGDNTKWTKISSDYTRRWNWDAPVDIKLSLPETTAKYLKIKALNNRDYYDLTIIAELVVYNKTEVKNVIAQNSSFINYFGNWYVNREGAFVSGATYNTKTGSLKYSFEGTESNIYVAKDTEVEIKVDGGKWEKVKLTGSLRDPSITLSMNNKAKHTVELRAINQEVAINMISTDGTFYK